MHIKRVEGSPFPGLSSWTVATLVLNKPELASVKKAVKILKDAECMVEAFLQEQHRALCAECGQEPDEPTLAELDDGLRHMFYGYDIEFSFLEAYAADNGIKLDVTRNH